MRYRKYNRQVSGQGQGRFMHRQRSRATATLALVGTAVLASSLVCMSGCRASDVLTEVVYDQSSDEIDYDNPTKYYINDSTAKQKSDQVPAKETSKKATTSDKTQNIVVYSSKPNHKEYTAKKSVFAKNSDFKGLEASEGVKFYSSKSKNAVIRPAEKKKKDKKTKETSQSSSSTSKKGTDGTGSGGTGSSSKKSGSTSSPKSKTKKAEQADKGGGGNGKVKVVDTTSLFSEPPKVNRIAAYGDAATIVQMVGGKGALVAADSTLLKGKFKSVFADEGASSIETGWSDDGSASKIDVDAIIKAKADTILCFDSDYQKGIAKADRNKLKKAKITFTVIPALTNTTYIEAAVDKVAQMLSEAKDIGQAGNTESISDSYADFADNLIKDCVSANGDKIAGSGVYENKNTGKYTTNTDAPYTLLIDGFDADARFSKAFHGSKLDSSKGVALATVGWKSSPASFYLQCGGLTNNAAYKSTSSDSGYMPVWQFNANQLSIAKSSWSKSPEGVPDGNLNKSAWTGTLLTTSVHPASNGVGASFGSDTFPNVIAATKKIKSQFVSCSKSDGDLYYPYGLVKSDVTNTFGRKVGSDVLWSSVGIDGADAGEENIFGDGKTVESAVLVNPHGLFSSWLGGSPEGVLEAAWTNDVAAGNDTKVDYEQKIEDFYSEFYRYDLTSDQLDDIVDGD